MSAHQINMSGPRAEARADLPTPACPISRQPKVTGRRRHPWSWALTLGIALPVWLVTPATAQSVLYVDADVFGANDGSSWAAAFIDLQDALDLASVLANEDAVEIWVAAGTYKPDRGSGDRNASFELVDNVALYGGFAGCETRRDQRHPKSNQTILSGDLAGNDEPDAIGESTCCYQSFGPGCDNQVCEETVIAQNHRTCEWNWHGGCARVAQRDCCELCRPTRCENSYTVVSAIQPGSRPILDGFTVFGGEANGEATSEEKADWRRGGGIYSDDASPMVNDCTFVANTAVHGTGMYAVFGEPSVSNSTFVENGWPGAYAEALHCWTNDLVVTDCSFIRNLGGGLFLGGSSSVVGCDFIANYGSTSLQVYSGAVDIIDCAFIGNGCTTTGGAVHNSASALIMNSTFIGNWAGEGGGRSPVQTRRLSSTASSRATPPGGMSPSRTTPRLAGSAAQSTTPGAGRWW